MTPITGNRVELQLLTTLKCNLACTYCSMAVGDIIQKNAPPPSYSIEQLQQFVHTHLDTPQPPQKPEAQKAHQKPGTPRDIYITFYGGEPTLNTPFIQQIINTFPLYRFQLQTNGTLLHRVPTSILSKLSNILISIDGGPSTTDSYRGKGIYKKVISNISRIRPLTKATITARVTYSKPDTTFDEIDALTEVSDYLYFQFVASPSYQDPTQRHGTLDKLIDKFFTAPRQSNTLYPVVPIMGIVRNKLFPSLQHTPITATQCRAATHLINVMPDGSIFPCPDLLYDPSLRMGSIQDNTLTATPFHTDPPPAACLSCSAFSWCRTNCLKNLRLAETDPSYAAAVVNPICDLVRYMGDKIDTYDLPAFYNSLTIPQRQQLRNAEIYDYVEIMP